MDMDMDRAGFVERRECYCDPKTKPSQWRGREWWANGALYAGTGLLATCPKCHAELAVFADPDGTRHPMVRRAGFWRDVALTVAELCASDEITPRAAVNIAVATIVAARDDLDAQENEEATT
jgi:hypothetical protein